MSQRLRPFGHHFEDFHVGQVLQHPTPRTMSEGDSSLYIALTGARHPVASSIELARCLGHPARPLDDLLIFNTSFGKTVPDISLNAIANLGYADVRFLAPVFAGDTLQASSEVIGLREASDRKSGVVYVRSTARNQRGTAVLQWIRWVLVRKADQDSAAPDAVVPQLPSAVPPEDLPLPATPVDAAAVMAATGCARLWDDFQTGERIDHPAGMTLDESDHTFATRLYQNNAKVHFDALAMKNTQHGARLVYGGHVISVCRALSYDGLENAIGILAINGGNHRAPTFAGHTLYCFTEVLDRIDLGRADCGALRLRLVGLRNQPPGGFADRVETHGCAAFHPDVVLDLDYTVLIPRRGN